MTINNNPTPDSETLGSCGCTDYHMADCPTRTGYISVGDDPDDFYDEPDYFYDED